MPGRFKRVSARRKTAAKGTELQIYLHILDKYMDYYSSYKLTLVINENIHNVNVMATCKIQVYLQRY